MALLRVLTAGVNDTSLHAPSTSAEISAAGGAVDAGELTAIAVPQQETAGE